MRTTLLTILTIGATIFTPAGDGRERKQRQAERLDGFQPDVLADMMHAADKGIPQDLMEPRSVRRHSAKHEEGPALSGELQVWSWLRGVPQSGWLPGWTAPAAMRIEGGSFGLQIGGSESDVVILINSDKGMKRSSCRGQIYYIGADATAAAGPVGR